MHTPPDAGYWCDHALNAVRFADGMRVLGQTGVSDLVEIGPGSSLLSLGRQSLNADAKAWLGSLSKRGELKEVLTSLGELYRRGFDIDWDGFNRPYPASARFTTDLSVRAPPLLDRGRCRTATDRLALQWIDRHALALGDAGCAIREHLQPAAFRISR